MCPYFLFVYIFWLQTYLFVYRVYWHHEGLPEQFRAAKQHQAQQEVAENYFNDSRPPGLQRSFKSKSLELFGNVYNPSKYVYFYFVQKKIREIEFQFHEIFNVQMFVYIYLFTFTGILEILRRWLQNYTFQSALGVGQPLSRPHGKIWILALMI